MGEIFSQRYQVARSSKIEFEVTHFEVLTVNGSFGSFNGQATRKGSTWSVELVIETKSIDTGSSDRDKVIVGPPYLDAGKYPEISFSGVGKEEKDKLDVNGTLTIKGISKKIKLSFTRTKDVLACSGIIIQRSDYGLSFGTMDALIGEHIVGSVKINLIPD